HDAREWIVDIEGVEGCTSFALGTDDLECSLAWTVPGKAFGFAGTPTRLGTHGGPRTCTQVAVVAGGHPPVEPPAPALSTERVRAADWAPTIAALLDLRFPSATGRSLLG